MNQNSMQLPAGITRSPAPPVEPVPPKPTAPVESPAAPAFVCRKLPQRLLTRSRVTTLENGTRPNPTHFQAFRANLA
jgi:hypothetical protein